MMRNGKGRRMRSDKKIQNLRRSGEKRRDETRIKRKKMKR